MIQNFRIKNFSVIIAIVKFKIIFGKLEKFEKIIFGVSCRNFNSKDPSTKKYYFVRNILFENTFKKSNQNHLLTILNLST